MAAPTSLHGVACDGPGRWKVGGSSKLSVYIEVPCSCGVICGWTLVPCTPLHGVACDGPERCKPFNLQCTFGGWLTS